MLNFNNKYTYVILAILIIMTLSSYANDPNAILSLVLTIPGVIIGITFHEFAHAYAAYKLGDDTPKYQGRLTLNPLAHLDPVGFVLLIFAHIGWGKPVEINPRNFNRKRTMTQQEAIVAVAGPLMNMFLAILFMVILYTIFKISPMFYFSSTGSLIFTVLQMAVIVNIGQGVFNLIPLPPLDGSKVLYNFLSYNAKEWFNSHAQVFYIIFLVIWITGLAATIISPAIWAIYSGLDWLIGYKIFGLSLLLF